jgi:hypothetical protein
MLNEVLRGLDALRTDERGASMSGADGRTCPYCVSRIRLSECVVVSDAVDDRPLAGFDAGLEDDLDEPADGAPGRADRVGGREVLWRPEPPSEPRPDQDRAGWMTVLAQSPVPVGPRLMPLGSFPAERLPRRACPRCQSALPPDLDHRDAYVLAVVGLNAAGKTHYLAAALGQAIRERGLTGVGCTEFAPDQETASRFHQDYYTRLFRDREIFEATQVDLQVRFQPLIFRVTLPGAEPFLLVTHDVSGEVLCDARRRPQAAPFLRRASAVVFLADPLEFDAVRARVPVDMVPPARSLHQVDLLSATLNELAPEGGRRVPVAVVISKADVLVDHLAAPLSLAPGFPADDWVQDVRRISGEVRGLLVQLGEQELVAVADQHRPGVTFHAVSAIGSTPQGMYIDRPQPRRCLDPLGTVLVRLASAS